MSNEIITTTVVGTVDKAPITKTGEKNGREWRMCKFTIKVTEENKKTKKQSFTWVSCVAWDVLADYSAGHIMQGSKVSVLGKPSARAYTSKDGEVKAVLEVTVKDVALLNGQPDMLESTQDACPNDDVPF